MVATIKIEEGSEWPWQLDNTQGKLWHSTARVGVGTHWSFCSVCVLGSHQLWAGEFLPPLVWPGVQQGTGAPGAETRASLRWLLSERSPPKARCGCEKSDVYSPKKRGACTAWETWVSFLGIFFGLVLTVNSEPLGERSLQSGCHMLGSMPSLE